MATDLVQWAEVSPIGVGEGAGTDLTAMAESVPALPDPRKRKPRSRPNRGRKRTFIGPFLETPPWGILEATGYPIPRDLTPLPRVPRVWRAGVKWRVWRDGVFALYGSQCHLCGHPDADSADHLVPLSVWGNQPYDPRLSRPAHGVAGCETCGLKCNSSRGNKLWAQHESQYQGAVRL